MRTFAQEEIEEREIRAPPLFKARNEFLEFNRCEERIPTWKGSVPESLRFSSWHL